MAESRDFSDEQVRGWERYFPSTLSKSLAALVIPGPWGAFIFLRSNMSWFGLADRPEAEQTLIAVIFCLVVLSAILFLIASEFASILASKKHRIITHSSYEYPFMSPRWFASNASPIHWLVLALVSAILYSIGFYTGRF